MSVDIPRVSLISCDTLKTRMFQKTFSGLVITVVLAQFFFANASQVLAAPPLVSCSAEQIRATERWWYFGNRGVVDFGVSGTGATFSTNPQSISMLEGSTVVTDTSGELQFYSNGQTIWNRNNQAMPNGTGLTAAPSATQTVASFPSLSRPGIYFVIHNGGAFETGGSGPLRYSEVDMSLNGGLGDVTPGIKNLLLDGGANTATEGLIAVPNADATGFWVITATGASEVGNHNIVAHEFDGDGPTGTIVRSAMSTPNGNTFATFNISPDMTKLVQHFGNFTGGSGQLRLLDIDAATGVISEIVTWDLASTGSNGTYNYSADFSPDGRYVYATRIFGTGKLFRYDIQTYTTAEDLEANIELIGSIGASGGQVKRAPNGRMYVANYNAAHLSVVNDPNNPTDPDFVQAGITLPAGAVSQFGLPQTVAGCPAPKNAPVNLTATADGSSAIDLAWSEPVDTDGEVLLGYKIDRSTDGVTWSTIVSNTGNTNLTYENTGLSADTLYYYRVFSVYGAFNSDASNIASARTDDVATYAVIYTAGVNGTLTGTTSQTVAHGASSSAVTAVPDSGYQFEKWSDDVTQNPRTDLNVTAPISVSAVFSVVPPAPVAPVNHGSVLITWANQPTPSIEEVQRAVQVSTEATSQNKKYCPLGTINRTLRLGMKGEDVRSLQTFLNCVGFSLAPTGPGSAGKETIHFSDRTHNALIRFQEAYTSDVLTPINRTKGTGIFAEYSKKKAQTVGM